MPTLSQIMTELESKGSAQTRKTYARHGGPDTMFGVKVGDLKPIAKSIKGNQALALELYASGNSDAMYLAGLVADGSQMSKKLLDTWAKSATWSMISEYTVPWVTVESPFARELAVKWIASKRETISSCGWATYAGLVVVREDASLDLHEIKDLLQQVTTKISKAANRVRYTMNGFVIAVGCSVPSLLKEAKAAATSLGKVTVEMGDTACKVPLASEYIAKVEAMGNIGKKRKTIKC